MECRYPHGVQCSIAFVDMISLNSHVLHEVVIKFLFVFSNLLIKDS